MAEIAIPWPPAGVGGIGHVTASPRDARDFTRALFQSLRDLTPKAIARLWTSASSPTDLTDPRGLIESHRRLASADPLPVLWTGAAWQDSIADLRELSRNGQELPAIHPPTELDRPTRTELWLRDDGFLTYAGPEMAAFLNVPEHSGVFARLWGPLDPAPAYVCMDFYVDRTGRPYLRPLAIFEDPLHRQDDEEDAYWLLLHRRYMRSPRVVEGRVRESAPDLPRSERRRLKRKGERPPAPSDVVVFSLRPGVARRLPAPSDHPRQYHVRFRVREHDRRLASGRTVRVRGHVKGPKDAPFRARRPDPVGIVLAGPRPEKNDLLRRF